MKTLWAAIVAASLFLCCPSQAQTPSAKAALSDTPASSTPKFVTSSELVIVPVVVQGKNGKHIPGLTKDAFTITSDGKPQNISLFEEVATTSTNFKPLPHAPDEYTNFALTGSTPRRLNIIVFDAVNTPFLSQARARKELIKFLSKSLNANEPTALLVLDRRGLHQIHPFTVDTSVLIKAMQRINGQLSSGDTIATSASDQADLQSQADTLAGSSSGSSSDAQAVQAEAQSLQAFADMEDEYQSFQQRNATGLTLDAMEQIASAYAGIPGRKNLIWATSGFPFMLSDPKALNHMSTEMVDRYERVWREFNDALISIYPVDLEGLVNPGFDRDYAVTVRNPRNLRAMARQPLRYDRSQEVRNTLRTFADATGGKPCLDRNDLAKCMDEAANDATSYYLLGFYLPSTERQPGWHKLKVHVDARSAHVRARDGFLEGTPSAETPNVIKHEVASALSSPLDFTGVHFSIVWPPNTAPDPKGMPAGLHRRPFELIIPGSSFLIDRANGNHLDLSVVAVIQDDHNRYIGEFEKSLTGNVKPELLARVLSDGVNFHSHIDLPAGNLRVRFAVRDNQTGKIGSLVAPIVVQ